jgi:hypothetical protein
MAIHEPPGDGGRSATGPSFPQRNAFVLQLAADCGVPNGNFRGRVEHVASGRQAVFASFAELQAFLALILVESSGATVPAAGDG